MLGWAWGFGGKPLRFFGRFGLGRIGVRKPQRLVKGGVSGRRGRRRGRKLSF